MRKVYGVPLSPFVRKVLLTLEIKGLDYELSPVTPLNLPEGYRDLSPLGKIPAYADDELQICDSSVICQYLEDRYPEIAVYPRKPASAARARWFEEYADTKLLEVLGRPLFFERVIKPRFLNQATDEEAVQKNLQENVPPVLDYLESVVKPGQFIVDDQLSIADLAITGFFINARIAQFEVDPTRWPKLAGYLEYVLNQPAFKNRLRAEAELMKA